MWLAQEVLSAPQHNWGDVPKDLARYRRFDLLNQRLPWDDEEDPNKFYIVMLGEIDMGVAMMDLFNRYPDGLEEPRPTRKATPMAYLLLDNTGRITSDGAVMEFASFAWGLQHALSGQLHLLRDWPNASVVIAADFEKSLIPTNEQNHWLPATPAFLLSRMHALATEFGLTRDQLRTRIDAFEVPLTKRKVGDEDKRRLPDLPLMNSLFLNDLMAAQGRIESNRVPEALAQYLAMRPQGGSPDLLTDNSAVAELLAPKNFPHARWPVAGGHGLVSLQQAAVNAVQTHLAGRKGVLAVNGPPGTGKTTLLRDLIAYCVSERAAAMVNFDNPKDAFSKTSREIVAGRASYAITRLHPDLRGYELLVASSNNRAVENVSLELPQGKAVEDGIHYFPSVAKSLYGYASGVDEGDDFDAIEVFDFGSGDLNPKSNAGAAGEDKQPPWGLIAAALGNSNNRANFRTHFWFDPHRGMQTYLKAVRGHDVRIKETSGHKTRYIDPAILSEEPGLSIDPAQQKREWSRLRKEFKALNERIRSRMADLEAARSLPAQYALASANMSAARSTLKAHIPAMAHATQERDTTSSALTGLEASSTAAMRDASAWDAARPGFLARIFGTSSFRNWNYEKAKKEAYARELLEQMHSARQTQSTAQSTYKAVAEHHAQLDHSASTLGRELTLITNKISASREKLGGTFVDADFFAAGHEAWNTACAWVDTSLQQDRADLFVLALAVHKCFVTIAAAEVQHNLGSLFADMSTGQMQGADDQELLAHLWSTLFLTVPVISTTFASVYRMLGKLPDEALGWLLVDEAGQASPQEAVGALMRVQRVVVVGDPMQIKPVTSLPEPFISYLAAQYGVSPSRWSATQASVQTLADHSSPVSSVFTSGGEPRLAGMPLLVHRRCQDPMFSISNAIAYDGQMVHAAGDDKNVPLAQVLGESAWLDVVPTTHTGSKWCAQEGERVLVMLRQLAAAGVQNPNIYLITPFVDVSNGLKAMLRKQPRLLAELGVDSQKWLQENVGTIHTFQGKEADAVIAVLGAAEDVHARARDWAAGAPNIANVMATRAKYRLYVVGSRQAWGRMGCFATVADLLPVR